MRHPLFCAAALIGAALAAAGCTTTPTDVLRTAALAPVAGAPGASDLAAGKAQFRQANYGLAEQHFRKAVELDARDREAWLGLAASYDELGRYDFADRAYAQLLKIAGRRPRILNNMGYSELLRGNRKKARKLLTEAAAALPGDPTVKANLALLDKS